MLIAFRPFVLLLGVTLPWYMAQAVTIELRASAEPHQARYTLADIATVRAAKHSERETLESLVLGETPRLGYSARIDRAQVEAQIARLAPTLGPWIKWQGANAVTLHGRGQSIAFDRLTDVAAVYLTTILDDRYSSLELRPVGPMRDLFVPRGKVSLHAQPTPPESISKRTCVRVEVHVDGQPYRAVPLWFDAKAVASVWMSKSAQAAGDALHPSDFQVVATDVAAHASPPLSVPGTNLDGLRLKYPLAAGDILLRSQVEKRPAVARHDSVTVALSEGGIVVQSVGIALGDGHLGEAVKIRNPQSQEIFTAKVVAVKSVIIDGR